MNTRDVLERIYSKADWIKEDAKSLADFVAMLALRRNYPTLAEEAIDLAEQELISALQSVRKSRAAFNAKPVEQSHAA